MKVETTELSGVLVIRETPIGDFRGHFSELFTQEDAQKNGIRPEILMVNSSRSFQAGAIRGLHWQGTPFGQTKLVRCVAGSIYDVAVDVRPFSVTYGKHYACRMSAGDRAMLYVPAGFAHGWQALENDSEIMYFVGGNTWKPSWERGLRFNDPALGIPWPLQAVAVAARDSSWPLFLSAESVG